MKCKECPYIQDELELRAKHYEDVAKRFGFPNDIYGDATLEEVLDLESEYFWCPKTGGKIWAYGRCEDAVEESPVVTVEGERHLSRREAEERYKDHLKFLADFCAYYPSPAEKMDFNRKIVYDEGLGKDDVDARTVYHKRYWVNRNGRKGRAHFSKNQANRKVRRYKGDLSDGNEYKNLYTIDK